jgi:hypothetical protein
MSTLKLELTHEELRVIYSALIDSSVAADERSDIVSENIDSVEDAYWIAQLVESKLQQKKANKVRDLVRQAINADPDFNWNYQCASEGEQLADTIKETITKGLRA